MTTSRVAWSLLVLAITVTTAAEGLRAFDGLPVLLAAGALGVALKTGVPRFAHRMRKESSAPTERARG